MPDLNQATSVKRAKRGYRRVSMLIKTSDYEMLSKMAEEESRTPDQQAAFLLRLKLQELYDQAIAEVRGNGNIAPGVGVGALESTE
jgi:hypothetical protein